MLEDVVTVILCGGRGTRAHPYTEALPKPLLPVAGIPVVEHVIGIFSRRGCSRFVLATGYLGDRIGAYFDSRRGEEEILCIDTGLESPTGERLRRCLAHVGGGTFFATYADGLADIDLGALAERHRQHGRVATVTAVPLPSQYGTLDIDDNERVVGFKEKPRLQDHWINAGFFALEPAALHGGGGDLERDILPELARNGELHVHRHAGFWRSLDTLKDQLELDELANASLHPPWW